MILYLFIFIIQKMWYIFVFIFIIIVVLILFLFNLLKEEKAIKLQQKNFRIYKNAFWWAELKESWIDPIVFKQWLSNLNIVEPDFINLKDEMSKKIVWMDDFINTIIVNMLVWGHLLVEWLPGLAKTKTINMMADILDMDFKRIQFTPDMLPSDIIWLEVFNSNTRNFEFKNWPVFTNVLLADEINRATPKVQSALLEAMQEKKVTLGWVDYSLPNPFFVLATQNPVEQEWTYNLPEAQVDRFLFKVILDYPTIDQEKQILDIVETESSITIKKIFSIKSLLTIQKRVELVTVSWEIKDYITRLVNYTRQKDERLIYGASPRASIWLLLASKALAYLSWRDYVTHEDVQRLSLSILRHRIMLSYESKIDWFNEDNFLLEILPQVTLE